MARTPLHSAGKETKTRHASSTQHAEGQPLADEAVRLTAPEATLVGAEPPPPGSSGNPALLQRLAPTQRSQLLRQIQRTRGNAQVSRMLAGQPPHSIASSMPDAPIQRKAGDCPDPAPLPAPLPPQQDSGFKGVESKLKQVAAAEKKHPPAKAKAQEAQAAAAGPPNDVASQAAAAQVGEMGKQKPGTFDKAAFVNKVLEAVEGITPRNEEEADQFKSSGKTGQVAGMVSGMVGKSKAGAEQAIKEKTEAAPDSSKATPKTVTPMQPEQAGPQPGALGAERAMPRPRPQEQVALDHTKCQTDGQMTEAGVTPEQLQKGNEPEFQTALEAKEQADSHAAQAPAQVRQQEQATLEQAKGEAGNEAQSALTGMHAGRATQLQQVAGSKGTAKSSDEAERAKIAAELESIYNKTKADVTKILSELTTRVDQMFAEGERSARTIFDNFVEAEMTAYKKKRYSGVGGTLLQVTDTLKITSLPPEVEQFYRRGRDGYLKTMNRLIGNIADLVGKELGRAKQRIADGRSQIDKYLKSLPKNLQKLGQEAAENIQEKFADLESDVNNKQDELAQGLSQKYSEALKAVDDRINQMREENKSLLDRAKEAVGGAIETIKKMKEMLLGVLSRAAGVIETIIKDPIGFLGNLISAIGGGLKQFLANIGTHLKKGLISWLFGALGEAGLAIPESFDLKGILNLVLSLLGLTYANIRARAVKLVGEKTVSYAEKAVEVFTILVSEGPAGLWKFIVEKLASLKDAFMEGLKSFLMEKVITAGITWILGLLNPAGAFIKACKAIYDIVMFIVERGSQIMSLVGAVLDSIGAIASGSIGGAIAAVENALAKALPVAIGFLASLLGLGGIGTKIRELLEKIQKPINKIIDGVVKGALGAVKKLVGKAKDKFGGKKEAVNDPEREKLIQKGLAQVEREEKNHLKDGKLDKKGAKKVAAAVKMANPVFSSIKPAESGETWSYVYRAVEGVKKGSSPKRTIEQLIKDVLSGKHVTVNSFAEADQVLFGAFPDAIKMRGAGPKPASKTTKQIKEFREKRKSKKGVYFHKDYLHHREGEHAGVLYGHEGLPDDHPHKTIAHINVEGYNIKGEYVDVTIYIDKSA